MDDVGFLTTLVQFLQVKHDLNPQRTFVCGMSNGGFMSYTLACQSSEVFRAMASVTGTMSGGDWASCQPTRPIPVLQITGISDNIVPLDGSLASAYGFSGAPHQDSIMQMWASLNGCTTRDSSFIPNSTHAITFKGASNGHEVWHYTIEDMGHEWPGTLVIKSPRDYYPYGTVASEVIWEIVTRINLLTEKSKKYTLDDHFVLLNVGNLLKRSQDFTKRNQIKSSLSSFNIYIESIMNTGGLPSVLPTNLKKRNGVIRYA